MSSALEGWAGRLASGDRRSLARALTAVENETALAPAILRDIAPRIGQARVIGITGPPGAGKSTLVCGLIRAFRDQDLRVGVLAVDPSSVLTGGAVLGDRVRMQAHAGDPEVFIRSVASRGHLGGLSLQAARAVDVFDAAGWDPILVETVGTGQSEVEIADLASPRVVVVSPGLGDDIQALKAGVLEIADLLVVNKCDLPYADRCENDLRQMIALRRSGNAAVPIFRTVATEGTGVDELAAALLAAAGERATRERRLERYRHLLAAEASRQLRQRLLTDGKLDALAEAVLKAETTLAEAARGLSEGN